MNRKYLAVAVLAVTLIVGGCATFKWVQPDNSQKLFAKTAVQYATIKVIKNKPAVAKKLADQLTVLDTMLESGKPVEAIKDYALTTVRDSSLALEDKMLCVNLIEIASNSIVVVAEDQNIDQLLITKEVITWVREALTLVETA